MKIIILLILVILNLMGWFEDVKDFDDGLFLMPLFSIVISVLFIFPKRSKGTIEIKILYIVIFGLLYFNSPFYFKTFLDRDDLISTLSYLDVERTSFIKANFLLGISLPLIITGYLVFSKVKKRLNIKYYSIDKLKPIKTSAFILFFSIFFILSLSATGLTLGANYIGVSSYNYVILFRAGIIICTIVVYNELIRSKLFANPKFKSVFQRNKLSLFVVFLFIVYVLIGGDRGPALVIILILGLGYLLINKMRVKYKSLIYFTVLFIGLSTLFTFIEVIRTDDHGELNIATIERNIDLYNDYQMKEGFTVTVTALAILGIEKSLYPHSNGFFLIQSIIKGVPYIGNKIIENLIGPETIDGTADLITIQKSGKYYTSGLGTSYLADTYIEFGLTGIILISFLYGFLIALIDLKCQKLSFKGFPDLLLISLFVGYSIYTGRGTLSGFLVNFIHTWIFYILIKFILNVFSYNIHKEVKWKK